MENFLNDMYMNYNIELHMYQLTSDAVLDIIEAAEEEMSEHDVNTILTMIRNDFYAECLGYAVYRDKYLHYLSMPDNRPFIKEAQRMMFQDMVINRTSPGLSFNDKDISLITPRTRKYMKTMKLIVIQDIHETPAWYNQKDLKGQEW